MPDFRGQRDQGLRPFQSGSQRIYIHIDPKPTSGIIDYGLTELGQISFSTPEPAQILVPDRTRFNKWIRVGRVYQPEEFQSVDFTTTANGAGRDSWEDLRKLQVEFTVYNTVGAVSEGASIQADDGHSWTQKGVLPDCLVISTSPFGESINSKSQNAESMYTGSIQYGNGYVIKTVEASPVATGATRNINDMAQLAYGRDAELFAVTAFDTGVSESEIIYANTGSLSSATRFAITAATDTSDVKAVTIVGNMLVGVQPTASNEGHVYASLDSIRAGAGGSSFARVTAGYVASKGPNSAFAVSEGNTVLVGNGGYIYKMITPTQGVSVISNGAITTNDLLDVRGANGQLVAVGASNTVVLSTDGGTNWVSLTGPSVGVDLNTVEVVDQNQWYVGNASGAVYFGEYNPNTGTVVWTLLNMFGGTMTAVGRIRFSQDKHFGWVIGAASSNANVLYRTTSAGARFSNKIPEFSRLSSINSTNLTCLAVVSENETFVGGASGAIGYLK